MVSRRMGKEGGRKPSCRANRPSLVQFDPVLHLSCRRSATEEPRLPKTNRHHSEPSVKLSLAHSETLGPVHTQYSAYSREKVMRLSSLATCLVLIWRRGEGLVTLDVEAQDSSLSLLLRDSNRSVSARVALQLYRYSSPQRIEKARTITTLPVIF